MEERKLNSSSMSFISLNYHDMRNAFDAMASPDYVSMHRFDFFWGGVSSVRTSRFGKETPFLRRVFDSIHADRNRKQIHYTKKKLKIHDVPRDSPLFMSSKLLGK